MKVKWKMSIGYPGATRTGEFEIDKVDLEGLSDGELEKLIDELVWEDAVQYVNTGWEIEE